MVVAIAVASGLSAALAAAGEIPPNPFHWSLTPLAKAPIPPVGGNPLDAFIGARRAAQLHPSPAADRRTLLHLLGIHHEQLTFCHGGIDRRLTDVHGQVVR
jgi:Protein of unknown function (DUF1501)